MRAIIMGAVLILSGCSYEPKSVRAINAYHSAIMGVCTDALKSESREWATSCERHTGALRSALREINK